MLIMLSVKNYQFRAKNPQQDTKNLIAPSM